MMQRLVCLVAFAVVALSVDGFTVSSSTTPARDVSSALHSTRREILDYSVATLLGGLIVSTPAAFADGFDDLSMPTEEEQKQSEVRQVLCTVLTRCRHIKRPRFSTLQMMPLFFSR